MVIRSQVMLVVLLACIGCSSEPTEYAKVSGTVTVQGEPLSGAFVTFAPTGATTGPKASTHVFDGKFQIDGSGKLHGGRYVARVAMIPREILKGMPQSESQKLPPEKAFIDSKYDAKSQQFFDIELGQPNHINIEVEFGK